VKHKVWIFSSVGGWGAILSFFVPQRRHIALMVVKFGVEESISAGVGMWGPKNGKLY